MSEKARTQHHTRTNTQPLTATIIVDFMLSASADNTLQNSKHFQRRNHYEKLKNFHLRCVPLPNAVEYSLPQNNYCTAFSLNEIICLVHQLGKIGLASERSSNPTPSALKSQVAHP